MLSNLPSVEIKILVLEFIILFNFKELKKKEDPQITLVEISNLMIHQLHHQLPDTKNLLKERLFL